MARKRPSPVVPLGASIRVAARQTGLSAATLRMWERRYGFPIPERRPGGSRVYTNADIRRLQLIARALAAGFRPGEVVSIPASELERQLDTAGTRPTPAPGPQGVDSDAPNAGRVVRALLADDTGEVRALLRAAAVALGPKQFVLVLAHPLMVQIGELWQQGELEVRHEHVATACVSAQLRLLLGALEDGAGGSPSVLLATLPHQAHALALEMVAAYLAASHAQPQLLGADTPPEQIVAAARALDVDAVGLSIPRGGGAPLVREQVLAIRRALPPRTELWLGGEGALELDVERVDLRVARSFADIDELLAALRERRLAASRGAS